MAKTLVEYITPPDAPGYVPEDRAQKWFRRGAPSLAFLPNPKYAGRRVEEFVTEADAKDFLIGTEQTKAFRIATDLFDASEREKVQGLIDAALAPVLERLAKLESGIVKPVAPAPPAGDAGDWQNRKPGKR